jgi:hypothetical protein
VKKRIWIGLGLVLPAWGWGAADVDRQHPHHTPPPVKPKHDAGQGGHEGSMAGRLGPWSMAAEGSGTSRLPESSPMFMKHLGPWEGFDWNLMGVATVNYADAGGKRGENQVFSNSMAMLMGRQEEKERILGFSLMGSLDAVFNGKKGYPNLFQTGETAGGRPLKDRQHPHDFISELAVSYSLPAGPNSRAFAYAGPVGEPALGGPMYLHRPSGLESPEAPISHHWFDATHISFGVLTLGATFGRALQIEGSFFNGHEPDEDRFDFDQVELNSASARVTYNPNRDTSLQVSYGFLDEPERLEPGEHQHRLTASALFSRPMPNGDSLQWTAFFGRNIKHERSTDAFGLEATYFQDRNAWFGRFEQVEKDELVDVPEGVYTIRKMTFGLTRDFCRRGGFDFGLGAFVAFYGMPEALKPFYGDNPVSWGVFLRVRPGRMDAGKGMSHEGH